MEPIQLKIRRAIIRLWRMLCLGGDVAQIYDGALGTCLDYQHRLSWTSLTNFNEIRIKSHKQLSREVAFLNFCKMPCPLSNSDRVTHICAIEVSHNFLRYCLVAWTSDWLVFAIWSSQDELHWKLNQDTMIFIHFKCRLQKSAVLLEPRPYDTCLGVSDANPSCNTATKQWAITFNLRLKEGLWQGVNSNGLSRRTKVASGVPYHWQDRWF